MGVAARAWETGQPALAAPATSWKSASEISGTSATVRKAMPVILNPGPTGSIRTSAVVSILFGALPLAPSIRARAMEKQPAWAAPMSSSGFVPLALSKREAAE